MNKQNTHSVFNSQLVDIVISMHKLLIILFVRNRNAWKMQRKVSKFTNYLLVYFLLFMSLFICYTLLISIIKTYLENFRFIRGNRISTPLWQTGVSYKVCPFLMKEKGCEILYHLWNHTKSVFINESPQ